MRRLSVRGCPLEMSDLESQLITIQINQDIKKQKAGSQSGASFSKCADSNTNT